MSKNMQIAEKLTQTVNTHDAVAVAQLYTEEATYMLPGEREPLRGRKAIEGSYRSIQYICDITTKKYAFQQSGVS